MIGNKLFDYEITRKVKAGGMGVVYEARRVWGKRERVAVKFLLEQLRDDENIRRRFIREAEILEMLNHPRIVRILGLDPERDAFVMEFIEGKTLSEHIRVKSELYQQPQLAVEMFAKLLDAFDYAHHVVIEIGSRREQGVVHRDIKPSNIIIEPDGSPKILDFGISRISTFESTLTDPKLQMGSVAYMSPEQIVNPAGVDWRSDIYALGVTLWELFSGRNPYPHVTNFDVVIQVQNSIRNEPLPSLANLLTDVEPEKKAFLERIDLVIAKATRKDPSERYERCNDMRADLLTTLNPAQRPATGAPAEPVSKPAEPSHFSPLQAEAAETFNPEPASSDLQNESATRVQSFDPIWEQPAAQIPVVDGKVPLTPDGSLRPVTDPATPDDETKRPSKVKNLIAYVAIGVAIILGAFLWWSQRDSGKTTAGASSTTGEAITDSSAATSTADSCNEVGRQYFVGDNGKAKDFTQALYWYKKSADLGNAAGQSALGSMYQNGLGVDQDYKAAMNWFTKSADQGNPQGQNNLGVMYYNGWGVSKDLAQALRWFKASADQGNADAQVNLGVMYEQGEGVAQNSAEALKLYIMAANQGLALGQYYTGVTYQYGASGIKQNTAKAIQWYKLAARQGNQNAQNELKQLGQSW
ncbi:hypothetical protein GCM10028807_60500 [Spirosoma daeguense]